MKLNNSLLLKYPKLNKMVYVSDGSCVKVKRSSFWKNIYFKKDFRLYFNKKILMKENGKSLYKFAIRF